MLLYWPRKYRSEDDDYAPKDYNYVGSVAEGERRRQATPIHEPESAAVRHRVEPGSTQQDGAAAGEGAVAGRGYEAARRLPRSGDAPPAARIAYPRPRDNSFAQNPTFAPQAPQHLEEVTQEPEPRRRGGFRTYHDGYETLDQQPSMQLAQEAGFAPPAPIQKPMQPDIYAPDGSVYAAASEQNMPEWLRVAKQNNLPLHADRARRAPRVEASYSEPEEAPQTDLLGRPITRRNAPPQSAQKSASFAEEYEAAGYPPELIAQQRDMEQETAVEMGYGRTRHGAQVAAPQPRRQPQRPNPGQRGPIAPQTDIPTREEYARFQAQEGNTYQQPYFEPRQPFAPHMQNQGMPEEGYNHPYTVTTEEPGNEQDENEEGKKLQIPWLGIAATAVALVVIGLWIAQMSFTSQTQTVLHNRHEAVASNANKYPIQYRDLIEREAANYNLHPAFVAAIVLNESSFNPKAESSVGARGLMQLMPDTAEWIHGKLGDSSVYSFDQMYDADTNVRYACWYLGYLSKLFRDDPILVSAAFHTGQNMVQNWLNDSSYSPDHLTISLDNMKDGPTKNYSTKVLRAFAAYKKLYYEGGLEEIQASNAVFGGNDGT